MCMASIEKRITKESKIKPLAIETIGDCPGRAL